MLEVNTFTKSSLFAHIAEEKKLHLRLNALTYFIPLHRKAHDIQQKYSRSKEEKGYVVEDISGKLEFYLNSKQHTHFELQFCIVDNRFSSSQRRAFDFFQTALIIKISVRKITLLVCRNLKERKLGSKVD